MSRGRRLWVRPLLCGLVSSGAGLAVLVAGRTSLPLPGGCTATDLERWWASTGWLVATFSIARVAVVAAAAIFSFGSLLTAGAAAGPTSRARAGRLATLARLPGGALVVRAALGVGASALVLGACGGGPSVASGGRVGDRPSVAVGFEPAPVLRNTAARVQPPTTARTDPVRPSKAQRGAPGSARPAAADGRTTAPPVPAGSSPSDPTGATVVSDPGPGVAAATGEWRVRPGDSLWSIAEATVGPSGQVPGYWARLVAFNRSRLPFPDDPSLLFPGDTVLLPPVQGGRG